MKKLLSIVLLGVAFFTFALPSPAFAYTPGDAASGAKIFTGNCNACHLGGKNLIIGAKTLQKSALDKYLKNYKEKGEEAIAYQVTKGKGAMPSFKGRLSDKDIANVAAYVHSQAQKGAW